MISDKDELNDLPVPLQSKVTVINVNANDHGYAKIRFDQGTLDNFVTSLYVKNILI